MRTEDQVLVEHPRIIVDVREDGPEGVTDALWIEDGRVVALGDEARGRWHAGARRLELDGGACVLPALTDAHCHLWGVGQRVGVVNLRGASGPDEVMARLERAEISPSGWMLGQAWDDHAWADGEALSLARLDAMFPDVPVCLRRIDFHAVWVNSCAMRRAGISPDWRPTRGAARRDEAGRLNGLLVDEAVLPIMAAILPPDEAEDQALMAEWAETLRAVGVTGAHMALVEPGRVAMIERMAAAGELPLRVAAMIDGTRHPDLDTILARGPRHDPTGWCASHTIKFFADGAMGSQGALLSSPYRSGELGVEVVGEEELMTRIPALMEAGWQVAVHAIGDEAARRVLAAFAAASPDARRATRPRLEHAQILGDAQVARFGELGVIASIQPIHLFSDTPWAHRVLHDAQLPMLFRFRDLAEQTMLCAGSDFPIDDPNPWRGIAAAMSRVHARGQVFDPHPTSQTLTAREGLAAYTTGAAYAAGWEDRLGCLRPGYVADLILVDRDPLAPDTTADSVRETQVLWASPPLRLSATLPLSPGCGEG